MAWSERQRAMLEHMGIRLFVPEPDLPAPPPEAVHPAGQTASAETDARAAGAMPLPTVAPTPPGAARPGVAPAVDRAPSPVDQLAWPALREAVTACRACALCDGRRQPVFGTGNERAQWMVVGEAPGEQEDREGLPFVGKSGQLLDNMLRALGLSRHDDVPAERQVYIANTVKCRPPGNRNPDPTELARCEPFLLRQVALVQPRVILAMGRFAVQSLLRSNEPIGRLRGTVHRYGDVPLVVTYHPAYLLRNPQDKARAWDDLCLARELMCS